MNEDDFNMEIRRFLKRVGITSQREIYNAVTRAIEAGRLSGAETLPVSVKLEMPALELALEIDGNIALDS